MKHGSTSGRGQRVILSLLATACLVAGSPVVANASADGAQKPVSASFGDCKNDNAGKHKGYVCPSDDSSSTGGGDTSGGGVITAS
jgi:hypothetical protein